MSGRKRSPMEIDPHKSPMDIHFVHFPGAIERSQDMGADELSKPEATEESDVTEAVESLEPPGEHKGGRKPARKRRQSGKKSAPKGRGTKKR